MGSIYVLICIYILHISIHTYIHSTCNSNNKKETMKLSGRLGGTEGTGEMEHVTGCREEREGENYFVLTNFLNVQNNSVGEKSIFLIDF